MSASPDISPSGIPALSCTRANILAFLSPDDVIAASEIDEHWFNAACTHEAWQSKLLAAPGIEPTLRAPGTTYKFCTPRQYRLLLSAFELPEVCGAVQRAVQADAGGFYGEIAPVLGRIAERHTIQFPVTEVLLRDPRFTGAGEAPAPAPPLDPPASRETKALPRWQLMVAFVARWHHVDPRDGDIPWLLGLYDALLTTEHRYTKVLAVPAVYALRPERQSSILARSDLDHILRTTAAAIERHCTCSSGVEAEPDDDDPRQLFGVYYHAQRAFPELAADIAHRVEAAHGAQGTAELAAAAARVERIIAQQAAAALEEKQAWEAKANSIRAEVGLAPKDFN